MIKNKDIPVVFSNDMENLNSDVYFTRNMIKLAIAKRFEIQLIREDINYSDYVAQAFMIAFDNYNVMNDNKKNRNSLDFDTTK